MDNSFATSPITIPAAHSAPLLIRRVDVFKVRLPLIKPVLMAGVELRYADNLLVKVEADGGLFGWGEATAAPSHGGASLDEMADIFKTEISSYLRGKNALRLAGITAELSEIVKKGKSAVAAVDLALHDLVGKFLGVPVHMLLGGLRRDAVLPLWLIGTGSVEGDLQEAERRYAEGYRFFKLKLGVKTPHEDIQGTLALRKRFGGEIRICADANMGMSAKEAITYAKSVADAEVDFLEQPLQREDVQGLRALVGTHLISVGLDESVLSVEDILRFAPEGISGVSLKTLKLGGLSGVASSGSVCDALQLQINLAGKIAETSIASAALLQLGGVLPNVNWGVSPSHLYLAQDVVHSPPVPEDGLYRISLLPGLGVDVDESIIRRFEI
jgi:L-alanine-DL-glutamate epimerase-like enolase superfamily enzyme